MGRTIYVDRQKLISKARSLRFAHTFSETYVIGWSDECGRSEITMHAVRTRLACTSLWPHNDAAIRIARAVCRMQRSTDRNIGRTEP